MFTVYHSNQLDLLKTLTSALIARDPLADPFQQEVVLVQSPGMAQWLQMQLAEQFGIAANVAFPLPATFIWDMFTRVLPDIPKESAFSKDAMTWKLMWLLPEMLTQPAFAPLQHYLTDDGDKRKIHQLAGRVADLFDQYLVYRPQWLESWQRGERIDGLAEAQQWQAPLWARLVEYTQELGQPEWHRANLYSRFIHALEQAKRARPVCRRGCLSAASRHCRRSIGGAAGAGAAYRYPPDVYQPLSLLLGRHSGLRFPGSLAEPQAPSLPPGS